MKQRLEYLDWAKGFAILLMLYGHTSGWNDWSYIWLSSFHMPIFFMIGGILISIRISKNQASWPGLRQLFIRRLYQLMLPYFIWGLCYSFFFFGLSLVSEGLNCAFYTLGSRLFDVFSLHGIASIWFLPCYFIAEQISYFICVITDNLKYKCLAFFICIVLYYATDFLFENVSSEFSYLQRIWLALPFFIVGEIACKLDLFNKVPVWCIFILLGVGSAVALKNVFVTIAQSYVGNYVLYSFAALFLSFGFLSFFRWLENNDSFSKGLILRIIAFLGANSIVVLCCNNFFVEAIHLLDHSFCGDYFMSNLYFPRFIFTSLLIVLEYPLILLSQKNLSILWGKQIIKSV